MHLFTRPTPQLPTTNHRPTCQCKVEPFRNISRPQTKNRLISKEKKAVFLRSKVVTASKNVEINSLASQCFREKKSNGSNSPQNPCLLYTSDAADEEDSVDLGGRRIIKKKKK